MAVEIKPVGTKGKKEYRVTISAELHQQLQDAQDELKKRGLSANINDEVVKTLERSVTEINRYLEKKGSAAGEPSGSAGGGNVTGQQPPAGVAE